MPHIVGDDCVLLVIDAQDGFYPASRTDVDQQAKRAALERIAWIAQ